MMSIYPEQELSANNNINQKSCAKKEWNGADEASDLYDQIKTS